MTRSILLLAAAGFFALPASAQMKVTTKQVCERHCTSSDPAAAPPLAQHQARLDAIRHQKKLETDPEKRKALEAEEERAVDSRDAAHEKVCRTICQYNPEE